MTHLGLFSLFLYVQHVVILVNVLNKHIAMSEIYLLKGENR